MMNDRPVAQYINLQEGSSERELSWRIYEILPSFINTLVKSLWANGEASTAIQLRTLWAPSGVALSIENGLIKIMARPLPYPSAEYLQCMIPLVEVRSVEVATNLGVAVINLDDFTLVSSISLPAEQTVVEILSEYYHIYDSNFMKDHPWEPM